MKGYSLTCMMIIALAALLLTGCAGTEIPRYYLLNSLPGETRTQAPCLDLGVGPIKLPEYLNRPQIVTMTSSNELALGQFDRWAEPLQNNFSRVLAENLTKLLCARSVLIFPWRVSAQVDYRIEAEVIHMDGIPGKEASLEVWWTIANGADKKILLSKQSRLREPLTAKDYGTLVQAQSRLMAALSRDMAEAIGKITK